MHDHDVHQHNVAAVYHASTAAAKLVIKLTFTLLHIVINLLPHSFRDEGFICPVMRLTELDCRHPQATIGNNVYALPCQIATIRHSSSWYTMIILLYYLNTLCNELTPLLQLH